MRVCPLRAVQPEIVRAMQKEANLDAIQNHGLTSHALLLHHPGCYTHHGICRGSTQCLQVVSSPSQDMDRASRVLLTQRRPHWPEDPIGWRPGRLADALVPAAERARLGSWAQHMHDLSSCCWQSKLPPRHLKNGQACSSTAHQPFMSSFVSRDTAKPPAMGPAMLMACTRHRCLRIPKSRWHAQIAAASPGKWMEHYPCFLTAADVIRKLNAARIVCAKKTKRTHAAQRPRLIGQRY